MYWYICFSVRYSWISFSGCRMLHFIEICFSSALVFLAIDTCCLTVLCHHILRAMVTQWSESILVVLFIKFKNSLSSQETLVLQFCSMIWMRVTNLSSRKSFLHIFPSSSSMPTSFTTVLFENDDLLNYLNVFFWHWPCCMSSFFCHFCFGRWFPQYTKQVWFYKHNGHRLHS